MEAICNVLRRGEKEEKKIVLTGRTESQVQKISSRNLEVSIGVCGCAIPGLLHLWKLKNLRGGRLWFFFVGLCSQSLLFIPRQILESLELCKSGTHGSNLSPWMVNLISIQT